ncbi:MAG TPA: outer membrane beta-barrel protein [Burkholderiales bacterium]|nr:outer membrane beta-barrel protein [Burkholderiales bacterium]
MPAKTPCLAGLLLALACSAAFAQDEGLYLGVGAGRSRIKDPASCSEFAGLLDPGYSCSLTSTDTGWKIFGGYQANRIIAFEVGYVDLGAERLSASGRLILVPPPLIPTTGSASAKIGADGFTFDMVLSAPITEAFSLSARAGWFAWTLKTSITANAGNGFTFGLGSQSDSTSGNSFDLGVGARYDFGRNVGVRVEFQRFRDIGDDKTGKSDVDLISASLIYRFR